MDQTTVFYGLLTIGVMIVAYDYLFAAYPDVDRFFVTHQTSIATMRRPGETAIHRSLVNPVGKRLMTGLSIRGKEGMTLRDGDMLDLWKLSCKAKMARAMNVKGTYHVTEIGELEWKRKVVGLAGVLKKWLDKIENEQDKVVAVALSNRLEWLKVLFATVMAGGTVVLLGSEDISVDALEEAKPVVLIAEAESWGVESQENLGSIKHVIFLDGLPKMTLPGSVEVLEWERVDSLRDSLAIDSDQLESALQTDRDVLRSIYKDLEGSTQISRFQTSQIVAAIASQIKALPISFQWCANDCVLTYTSSLSLYTALLSLTAIVSGSSLIFLGKTTHKPPLDVVQELAPTIVVTDDATSYTLANSSNSLTLFGNIRLAMARVSLSRGILPTRGIYSEFTSVRIVHSSAVSSGMVPAFYLTSADANTLRALTGARFIHGLCSPLCMGPITQTGFYDYRQYDEEIVSYGAPVPGLEIMLRDSKNQYWAQDRKGELYVRGCQVAGDGNWKATGIIGQLKWGTFATLEAP